jgi:hypothetical protein
LVCPPVPKAEFWDPAAPKNCCLPVINAPPADQVVPLYSSVHVTLAGVWPPKYKAKFCWPVAPPATWADIIAPPAAQVVPLYSSVHVKNGEKGPGQPLTPRAEFWVPATAIYCLPVIKFPPDAHEVPLYSSVTFVAAFGAGAPPTAKPAFCVPAPPKLCLVVIRLPPVDHDMLFLFYLFTTWLIIKTCLYSNFFRIACKTY